MRRSGRTPRMVWTVGSTLVPALWWVGAAAVQIHLVRQRYGGVLVAAGLIDTTVVPPDRVLADGRPVEMVALGDSGMAGVGVDRLVDTLPVLVASRVAARTGRPVHVVSYGRSGARTRDVLSEQMTLVRRRPDVVVLLVGTNDVTHLTSGRALAKDTASLLSALSDLGSPVVMSSLPEFRAMRAMPRVVRAVLEYKAASVRKIQRRSVRDVANVRSVNVRRMVGHEFVMDVSKMSADHFHPSAAGYARIADVLTPAVAGRAVAEADEIDQAILPNGLRHNVGSAA